jgi:ribosomal protein S5
MAGIKDVCAKYLSGSKNSLNNAKVAVAALAKLISVPRSSYKATIKDTSTK